MSGWKRLMRLWKLSKYDVKDETLFWNGQPIQNDLRLVRTEKPKERATFIPRTKRNHIQELTQDA